MKKKRRIIRKADSWTTNSRIGLAMIQEVESVIIHTETVLFFSKTDPRLALQASTMVAVPQFGEAAAFQWANEFNNAIDFNSTWIL